jgi:tetrahydromethanopterin S-methyltransferase, F subunit
MSKKSEIQNRMAYLDELTKSISYRSQLISRSQKPDSGIAKTRRIGFLAGFSVAVLFVLIIPLIFWKIVGAI